MKGGVLIYDNINEFNKNLSYFLLLAIAINNKKKDLKFYVPNIINDEANLKSVYKANALIYHPDKLKNNSISKDVITEFFSYITTDVNDTKHVERFNINIQKSFIYLLYLKLSIYYGNQINNDNKGSYIFFNNLVTAIKTYFYNQNKDKINFISLNDEEITTVES